VLKVGWIPSAPPTVGLSIVFSPVDHKQSFVLVLHNLPLVYRRRPAKTKIDLILHAVSGVDNRLNGGIDDFAAVHVDTDFVSDFGCLGRHALRVSRADKRKLTQ